MAKKELSAELMHPTNLVKLKVVLLGDTATGKTAFFNQLLENRFDPIILPTIGANGQFKMVDFNDGVRRKVFIWDTAGQERFRSLAPLYYRDAHGAIILYDITDRKSFISVISWWKELRDKGKPDVVIALAGNKMDLSERRAVSTVEAQTFAAENGLLFMETSAKLGDNIDEIFNATVKQVKMDRTTATNVVGTKPIRVKKLKSMRKSFC